MRYLILGLWALLLTVVGFAGPLAAQGTEQRLGLVIGNGEYTAGALPTAANDAGLVAQTLQAAGFDVMGARDLDGDALRNTFRDFVDKVAAAGPDTVAFVYLSGHGIQYEGENYFVPVDARIERDVDVPLRALRISDYVRPLGALNPKAVVVVLDAARESPFARGGQPLAGGLALVEPSNGLLYAFNAAPGTIGTASQPPYGAYAQALAEMLREGGLPINNVFDRVRMRVHEATSGSEVPWHASNLKLPLVFFERAADAPRRCRSPRPSRAVPGRFRRSTMRVRLISQRSSATRCRAISTSCAPIPTIRRRSACVRSWRHVAKRSLGDARAMPTRRRPTGPTSTGIRTVRTHTTHAGALRF